MLPLPFCYGYPCGVLRLFSILTYPSSTLVIISSSVWSVIIVHGESPVLLSVLLASLYIKVGALAVYKVSSTTGGVE